jgi:hypothetical protein
MHPHMGKNSFTNAWAHDITQQSSSIQEKELVKRLYQQMKDFANGNAQNNIAIMSLKI